LLLSGSTPDRSPTSFISSARWSTDFESIAPTSNMYHDPAFRMSSVDAGAERRRKFERSAPSIFRAPGEFKCRDCKHNGGKDRTCIGDKRAVMCADCAYALPNDHEPRNIAMDKHAQSVR
jgi:hypothetical protein